MIYLNSLAIMRILFFKSISFCTIFLILISTNLYADEWEYIERGARLEKQNKFTEALVEYKQALLINSNIVMLYSSIGNIYQRHLMDISKAIDTYEKGFEIKPDDLSINFNLLYAYAEIEDHERSIKHYKILSKIRKKGDYFTFPKKALRYFTQEMTSDEIIGFCNEYLSDNPSDIVLREKVAEIYLSEKDYNNAKIQLEAILKNNHSRTGIYFELGVCYYYLEEYQKSYDNFIKAKEENEYVPNEYLEMVIEKLGKTKRKGSHLEY